MQFNPEALKVIRERSGLSLTELARRTGIHLTALSHIEKGRRPGTNAQIVAVARALDVSVLAISTNDRAA